MLVRNVAPRDQGDGDSNAKNKRRDSVDERRRGWDRAKTDVGERQDEVVHNDVNTHAIKSSPYPGMTGKGKPVTRKKIDRRHGGRDDEVQKKPEQGRAHTLAVGRASDECEGDPLQDA